MRCFWRKTPMGLVPADEFSEKVYAKTEIDELIETDTKSRGRNLKWHRRYWGMLQFIVHHTDKFKSLDEAHFYLKCQTGTWDSMIKLESGETVCIVRSIAFSEMTSDEWSIYWGKVVDVVSENILPDVCMDEVAHELERFTGLAA